MVPGKEGIALFEGGSMTEPDRPPDSEASQHPRSQPVWYTPLYFLTFAANSGSA
jgi:hypothetical protein